MLAVFASPLTTQAPTFVVALVVVQPVEVQPVEEQLVVEVEEFVLEVVEVEE
jgi:hypothetical protein